MLDADFRLAAKLAYHERKTHPMAWGEIYEAHNSYESAMQIALMQVEPWGEDREDFRQAVMATNVIESQAAEVDADRATKRLHSLRTYLSIYHQDD